MYKVIHNTFACSVHFTILLHAVLGRKPFEKTTTLWFHLVFAQNLYEQEEIVVVIDSQHPPRRKVEKEYFAAPERILGKSLITNLSNHKLVKCLKDS